jgi:RNA polymerase sigma-70 factor (ECF subfamily)
LSDRILGPTVDDALVLRALAGEGVAFELLVVKYQRRVAAVIRQLVIDDRVTEELTQEVFLSVHRGLASYRPGGEFAAWLFTIARNAARSYLRSAQNRLDDRPQPTTDEALQADHLRTAPSPEEESMARELFEHIEAEMSALPDLQRQALWLREIEGLDYQAIAQQMAQPVNTVKSHIHRARTALAKRLQPLLASTRHRRW